VDDCMWQLQDSHKLIVTLQKLISALAPAFPPPIALSHYRYLGGHGIRWERHRV
jgi:hypothetical protein